MGIIIALLALWLVLVVLGFAIKAFLWLAIVGIVLFVATLALGVVRSVKP